MGVPDKKSAAVQRPLRADARRNRERVLTAAQEVFAERGTEATLAEVAARAGVGVGTIYRHYANKTALLDDVFDARVSRSETSVEDGLGDPDPWNAFVSFIEGVEEAYVRNRALGDLLKGTHGSDEQRALARERIFAPLNRLIQRAKDAGKLRADFSERDVDMIHTMLSAVIRETEGATPGLWRRYFEIVIDGFAGDRASTGVFVGSTSALVAKDPSSV